MLHGGGKKIAYGKLPTGFKLTFEAAPVNVCTLIKKALEGNKKLSVNGPPCTEVTYVANPST